MDVICGAGLSFFDLGSLILFPFARSQKEEIQIPVC